MFTPEKFLTLARLTREKIAPSAATYDRDAVNPIESWRDLWQEGLLAASVPRTHGGLGLEMPTASSTTATTPALC